MSTKTRGPYANGLGLTVLTIFALVDAPTWALQAIASAGLLLLGYKFILYRRWHDEVRCVPKFILCFTVMLVELILENCFVWLVSATDLRKYDNVSGLQDNVQMAISLLSPQIPLLGWFAAVRWATVMHFLLALLALPFSVVWDQIPFSGFGLMSRVLATIAASRLIRVACFMSTVLPNPRPGCYSRRFPPVPDTTWGVIKAGYTTIRGFGGCNDLIFSGHGAFWVLAPLAHMTYYRPERGRGRAVSLISLATLWIAQLQASLRDIVEGHHYAVDMILAVVVTWACWTWLEWIYPPGSSQIPIRPKGSPPDRLNPWILALVGVSVLIAGIIIIGGKA